ncbi:adenine deaminase, partial [Candidatus Bathyarchaeota archaeon]|nr:adenine deaminase [Candidatus Bathyarchaeota archaeon]
HLDYCLRRAVEEGLDPIDAVRMVTIKPAEYFGLKKLGGLSPGKSADMVIVDDLKEFRAEAVFIDGKLVAEDGRYLGAEAKAKKPFALPKSVNIGGLRLEDLRIEHPNKKSGGTIVRVIGLIENQIITEEIHQELSIVNGEVKADPTRDILKICVVERHKGTGRVGKGFVRGFGLKSGAVASTFAHDSHNIIAVGVDDREIYRAIWRLREIDGGFVIVSDGLILEELPLPVAGLMTTLSASEIAEELSMLEEAAVKLGCKIKNPFTALSFLSLPVIPKLKITDLGLIDAEKLKIVNLFVD